MKFDDGGFFGRGLDDPMEGQKVPDANDSARRTRVHIENWEDYGAVEDLRKDFPDLYITCTILLEGQYEVTAAVNGRSCFRRFGNSRKEACAWLRRDLQELT